MTILLLMQIVLAMIILMSRMGIQKQLQKIMKMRQYPPLDAPAYMTTGPFKAPVWCKVATEQTVLKNYDLVGHWVRDWIKSHDCKEDAQVVWDFGGTPASSFAISLYHVASQPDVHMVFEVGAFRGCGSTLVLSKAVMDGGGCLVSFEVDPTFRDRAASNIKGLPTKFEFGCMGGADGFQPLVAEDNKLIEISGPLFQSPPAGWKTWWTREKALCNKTETETGRLTFEKLCLEYEFDFGLFDGGEFYGESEFLSGIKYCPSLRYVALDDVDCLKNWKNYQRLKQPGSGWEIMYDSHAAGVPNLNPRQGWAVFKREGLY